MIPGNGNAEETNRGVCHVETEKLEVMRLQTKE